MSGRPTVDVAAIIEGQRLTPFLVRPTLRKARRSKRRMHSRPAES
jgi:hypothetical protein